MPSATTHLPPTPHFAAYTAAVENARTWATEIAPGEPWHGAEDYRDAGEVHLDTIAEHLGLVEGAYLTDEELAVAWPIYRDTMRAEVERLRNATKGHVQ